ncbi:MlaD family protein [Tellurirhabdus rosea]|uniref:MlaD family protein n=1 Tax=Tellurirhabdus rosea TaxID=2674997 RepID=UPI0022521E5F|nr:MlaD family protein [Tellurirhabdus rosea]
MNSGDNKRAITVGIFIAVGIAILVTGIVVLGGQQKRFVKTVHVFSVFDDVGGLQVGNNVWFSGVKIGTVRKIRFYGTSQVEIMMNIEESSRQYIRKDAKASLSTDGLIGNKIVQIVGGSPRTEPVEDGDRLQANEALSSDEIMETLQANNQNLLKVTTDVKNIVDKISKGKGMAGAVLTDDGLAVQFRAALTSLQSASENANRLSGSLNQYTSKLNRKGTLAYDLVSDTVIFNDLRTSSARLRQASAAATEITGNITKATDRLNSRDNAVGLLLNDETVNRDLKATIRNLESSTQKLDENMEALQHNFLLRGFFRKRAKEEAKQKEAAKTTVTTETVKGME